MSAKTLLPASSDQPVHTLWRSLPGRAVSAAALVNGTLWLIIDPRKDGATQCVAQMLWGN